YYFLARAEEQECLARFGVEYAEYQAKTGMFFPRVKTISGAARPSGSFPPKTGAARIAVIVLLYVLLIAGTVFSGHAVRKYALSTLASYSDDTSYVLSLVDLDRREIRELYETVISSDVVKAKIPSGGKRLVYLLPEAWHIPELPVGSPQDHVTPDVYDESAFKMLIASPTGPAAFAAAGNDILGKATGFKPHALVFVNRGDHTVKNVTDPPLARWSGIAVPLF
ncbi:MAG TPA: hypothetical protein VN604_10130, partial [Nitrospirota bacterium]|nr:hypothetical protein [Nitrospirota bacterium]